MGSIVDIVVKDGWLLQCITSTGYLKATQYTIQEEKMESGWYQSSYSTMYLDAMSTGCYRLPFISVRNHGLDSMNICAEAS